jgi:hypothetical protein
VLVPQDLDANVRVARIAQREIDVPRLHSLALPVDDFVFGRREL